MNSVSLLHTALPHLHASVLKNTTGYARKHICMHSTAACTQQHDKPPQPKPCLTMALAGAKGRAEAARPMIGTDIAVLLLIWAGQGLPAADLVRATFAPQKGLPICWCVLAPALIEQFILPVL